MRATNNAKAGIAVSFVVALFVCACGGAVDRGDDTATLHASLKINDKEILLVSLGASTSAGITFDPGILGLPLDPVYAGNHHLPLFAAFLEEAFGSEIDVYNLAVPGATSGDVLSDQLPDALEEIPRYLRGSVITVEGGGNDLRAFQVAHIDLCLSPDPYDQYQCMVLLNSTLGQIEDNLRDVLTALRQVAPDAPIVLQTQYNSLYGQLPDGTPCADAGLLGIADAAMEGDPAVNESPVLGLNPRIRALAVEFDAMVGDVAGYLYTAPGELYKNPAFYGPDCTHLAGTRDAIDWLGLPADTAGLGYQAILGSFVHPFLN